MSVFTGEIVLEFVVKAAILNPRQSSGVRSFQDSQASEYGERSKAAAFLRGRVAMFSLNQCGLFRSHNLC
jgi:hypothetical protein